jgi:N-acetylglucosaminyldiphosphoundecaprenol N-acetyl-beta-D-mannosaminyltransferase
MREEVRRRQRKSYAAIINIHVMALVEKDPELAAIISDSDVSFCDSISIVKLGRREGKIIPRFYGPDYMVRCCDYGRGYGWRHFFLGGAEGVAEKLAQRLEAQFPGVQVAGTFCPPFRDMTGEEVEKMIATINRSKPDIVWVGLGAGKQDKWIQTYKDRIDATWFSGVGAAFDFLSGNTKRAPIFWRRLGLEWLYRFKVLPVVKTRISVL